MFDYPLLEVLIAIERNGDFERAAKSLGVSKSYVSQRLCLLEDRMGANVVCRETQSVNQFGNRLCRHFEYVRLLEQQFLHRHNELFDIEDPGPITITVAVGDESLDSWFRTILRQLHSSQNRLFLDVIQASEAEIEHEMMRGGVYAAISAREDTLTGFNRHYLGQHAYKATATPDFIHRFFKDGVSETSLLVAPAMQTSLDSNLRHRWMKQAVGHHQSDDVPIVPSVHALVNTCLEGEIWAVNSSILVDQHLSSGRLVELLPGMMLTSDLYWHVSRFLSHSMRHLTACILSAFEQQFLQVNEETIARSATG